MLGDKHKHSVVPPRKNSRHTKSAIVGATWATTSPFDLQFPHGVTPFLPQWLPHKPCCSNHVIMEPHASEAPVISCHLSEWPLQRDHDSGSRSQSRICSFQSSVEKVLLQHTHEDSFYLNSSFTLHSRARAGEPAYYPLELYSKILPRRHGRNQVCRHPNLGNEDFKTRVSVWRLT